WAGPRGRWPPWRGGPGPPRTPCPGARTRSGRCPRRLRPPPPWVRRRPVLLPVWPTGPSEGARLEGRGAVPGQLVDDDAGGDPDVEALGASGHRYRDPAVAGGGHLVGEPGGLLSRQHGPPAGPDGGRVLASGDHRGQGLP